MRRSSISLGDKNLIGEYSGVYSAGDLNVQDSHIKKLYAAGDVDIANSSIKKIRAAGDVNITDSIIGNLSVAGNLELVGENKGHIIVAVGDLKVDDLKCRVLRNYAKKDNFHKTNSQGTIQIAGCIETETFENFISHQLSEDLQFSNLISKEPLYYHGIIECDRAYIFDCIEMEGINGDYVYIKPFSQSKINNIYGEHVHISEKFRPNKKFKQLPKSVHAGYYKNKVKRPSSIMKLDTIEADAVYVDHVNIDLIVGKSIKIGEKSIVKRVEYSDKIHISEKAVVNEVIKI